MNNIINTSNQTPIEIALGIDENGMTTASKLYAFLELSQSNYSKWCKTNIAENEFAEENVDFKRLVIKYESGVGVKEREDFKLTAHFAKKLSMKGNGVKAEEAREYFTRLEEKAKEIAIDREQLSPQMQLMNMLVENMSRQELEQNRQAEKITALENNQKAINAAMLGQREKGFKSWVNRCLSAIAESSNYLYIGSREERHQAVRAESYERLNNKKPCRLSQRVESEKGRAAIAGASATKIKGITKLSIIESDKALKPLYEMVIREMMIAYCVEVAGYINFDSDMMVN